MGKVGNDGTLVNSYQSSIGARTAVSGNGAFAGGASYGVAESAFGSRLDYASSFGQGSGSGAITARGGESLQAIAASLWGDSGLWYKLAQANGLSGDTTRSADPSRHDIINMTLENGTGCTSRCTMCVSSRKFVIVARRCTLRCTLHGIMIQPMTLSLSRPLALILASITIACTPIKASQAPAPATTSGFPAPDRPVATIITSHSGSEEFRDRTGEAAQTMAAIGVAPGLVIADIGAGDGYFTTRLSPALGPTGKVIATDVTPQYLAGLQARVAAEKLANVTTLLGGFDDPKLPPASVDVALMVRMYHEIEQPYAFLWHLRDALKPGGTVAVSERDRPTADHGTPPDLLKCEFEAVGYTQVSLTQMGPQVGYVAIFAPTNPRPESSAIEPCGRGG
jgi:SAM-dependent methyltransferase